MPSITDIATLKISMRNVRNQRGVFSSYSEKRSVTGMACERSSVARSLPVKKLRCTQAPAVLIIWAITVAVIVWTLKYSWYTGIEMWDRVAYVAMMCLIFHFLLVLDAYDKFHDFHVYLENMFCGHGKTVLSISLLLFGFADYIMIEVYYSLLDENGPMSLFITLYVF